MKRAVRKYHCLIASAVCLPLIMSVVTGSSITLASERFHSEELSAFFMKVEALEIFGLAVIYLLSNRLGLIGLIVTGLSMTGLCSQGYKPKRVNA